MAHWSEAEGGLSGTLDASGTIELSESGVLTAVAADSLGNRSNEYYFFYDTAATPLVVDNVSINNGAVQRSNMESLAVRFNAATNLPTLIANGSVGATVQVVSLATGTPLKLAANRYR
jgi:hypothetical protein